MFCPKCGKPVRDGARFCNHCGAVLKAESEWEEDYDIEPEPHSSSIKWVILLIVLILALLGGACFAMFRFGFFDEILPDWLRQEEEVDDREEPEWSGLETLESQEFYTREEVETLEEETEVETSGEIETESSFEVETSTFESLPVETSVVESSVEVNATVAMESTTAVSYAETIEETARLSAVDYILPESSSRYLVEQDLDGLTKEELRLARNEIYARHGRAFQTEDLKTYFESKSWYRGTVTASEFSENLLSQVEKDNIKMIKQKEEQMQ